MAASQLHRLLLTIEKELRPEDDRVADAKRRAHKLIDDLRQLDADAARMFQVHDAISHGSHARDTAIAGFKDIDYLVILDPAALRTESGTFRTAGDTVQRLARVLRERRGGLVAQGVIEVRAQDHSVGVKYPGSQLRVDLVPALRTKEQGRYKIPSKAADAWIDTRPHLLKRAISVAENKNPHVRGAIRLLKGWRRARGKAMQIPSYAIELLLGHWAAEVSGLKGLVFRFFDTFADAHAGKRLVLLGDEADSSVTIRDPWSGDNVAEELDAGHRARLVENARRGLSDIEEAEALADEGRDRAALSVLRGVFKGNYD